jgi:hemoglobin/transferrin/lactoferrin receptor protein
LALLIFIGMRFVKPHSSFVHFKRTTLAAAISAQLFAPFATAQSASSSAEPQLAIQKVAPVIVSGSRSARANEDVPATVSVITDEEIENKRIENIKDLVRDEPAVTVRRQPSRFSAAGSGTGRDGNAGFNIRGIDGNRVLIQVDGIRIPSAFNFGATNIGRSDYLDVSAVSRVEILRGPASALYGSDGLAGAVSFYTREPNELLRKFGSNAYGSITGSYSSDDKSVGLSAAAALRADKLELLAMVNHRQGHELKNFGTVGGSGSARTQANPSDTSSDGGLIKWVYRLAANQKIAVTLEKIDRSTDTDVLTARNPVAGPPGVAVATLVANDETQRTRGTVQYTIDDVGSVVADRAQLVLYSQDGRSRQFSAENRSNGVQRQRDQRYTERLSGLSMQAEREITGAISQRIVYGLDASWSESVGSSNGTLPPAGETFPVKRFPDTKYNLIGAFAQNEIGFADNQILLIPALRFDRYELKPEASAQYPSGIPAGSTGSHLSPKLGVVWKLGSGYSTYVNVANGYKAPAPNEVNQGFSNLVQNYQSIANPNLKPETNVTVEIGARKLAGPFTFEAAAFAGRYKDFIGQVQVGGDFTATNPTLFQFRNLSSVKISGAEAKLRYAINPQWALSTAAAYTKGTQETDGVSSPLLSVNPIRVVATASHVSGDGQYGIDLTAIYSAAKKLGDVSPATQFLSPSSTTLDINGYWRFHKNAKLTLAVNNLTDRKYWNWSDVQGLSTTSTLLDAYTQPGRAYSLGLKVEF